METPNTYIDLFWGYTAVWALIAAFVLRLWVSQRRLARELSALSARKADETTSSPRAARAVS